jgi:hypothetical protein
MDIVKRKTAVLLIMIGLFTLTGCDTYPLIIALPMDGSCPEIKRDQRVVCEGYISYENGVALELFEENRQYHAITFTIKPEKGRGLRTANKFRIGLLKYQEENDASTKANQMEILDGAHNVQVDIYDEKGSKLDINHKVRVTGKMVKPCFLQVEKIERL